MAKTKKEIEQGVESALFVLGRLLETAREDAARDEAQAELNPLSGLYCGYALSSRSKVRMLEAAISVIREYCLGEKPKRG